jgi:hypothetical protein
VTDRGNESLGRHRPATRASRAGRTAITVVARDDDAVLQTDESGWSHIADMANRLIGHRQIEHLIEVAIVDAAVPADRERVPAHDAGRRGRIKRVGQALHIALIIPTLEQEFQEAADWHIGNRIEMIEADAIVTQEFSPKLRFNGLLFRRQKCPHRIVHQIQREPASVLTLTHSIKEL